MTDTAENIPYDFRRMTILQGDVALIPVEHFGEFEAVFIEASSHPMVMNAADNRDLILAHSETGHHHVVESSKALAVQVMDDPSLLLLEVYQDTQIMHRRDEHQHAPQLVAAGKWRVQRQVGVNPRDTQRVVFTD